MTILLPQLFSRKLSENAGLLAAVTNCFDKFEPWLEQSGMPFFPGFTDHSPRHINDVLKTAASLISDVSHQFLSAEDVAVLCIAILLHDCGMHLTQDSFRKLVETASEPKILEFDKRSWPLLWEEYLGEARRFGQDKLMAIFGNFEPLEIDKLQLSNLSEKDCYLIGEFVRRHHTRLAHEIALNGISRSGADPLEITGIDIELRDIAGLIARSHGMSIRSTFDYIEKKFGLLTTYRNVKIPFLMAVLRIADYVQVQSERALKGLLSVKELRSPISRQEWQPHFAVKDISTDHADPEALYVHAAPLDAKMFLKLTALFKDIQRELDESWATLGEVYGRHREMASLGLTIRRVRSNLDNVEKFSRSVSYFPTRARFDASGPDLLRLLVGPLYDYDYTVGVRELVQNAVDACREAGDLLRSRGQSEDDGVGVVVEIEEGEDGTGWITVTDSGVGMTLDTVTKFYLIAGASFRNSDAWKKQHTDHSGRSRILRGGRFGVGALAAFLLGDEISVRTRHIDRSQQEGIEFTARIDDSVVELRRSSAPSGTSIKVFITNSDVFDALRPHASRESMKEGVVQLEIWNSINWFMQSSPSVQYRWSGYDSRLGSVNRISFNAEYSTPASNMVPLPDVELTGWIKIPNPEPYREISWRYLSDSDGGIGYYNIYSRNKIVVNGIKIQEFSDYAQEHNLEASNDYYGKSPSYRVRRPTLSILDPNGLCPINLQRSSVAFDRMGMDEKISRSIIFETFKFIRGNYSFPWTLENYIDLTYFLQKNSRINFVGQVSPVFISSKGVFLSCATEICRQGIKTIYFVDADIVDFDPDLDSLLDASEAFIFRLKNSDGIQNNLAWFRGLYSDVSLEIWSYSSLIGLPDVLPIARGGVIPSNRWSLINEKGKVRKDILASVNDDAWKRGYKYVSTKDSEFDVRAKVDKMFGLLPKVSELVVWELGDLQPKSDISSDMLDVWRDVFK